MIEPQLNPDARRSDPSYRQMTTSGAHAAELSIPERYELLLAKLARAERELSGGGTAERTGCLEEASALVFGLLYDLDFKHGGELVPRLAGLYGYVASELVSVGRTGDLTKLRHVRDIISSLRRSWDDDGQEVGKNLPFKNVGRSPILDGGGK
jgi:flagellin-specific chaperone FliS